MITLKQLIGIVCIICAVCSLLTGDYFVGCVGIIIGGLLVFEK